MIFHCIVHKLYVPAMDLTLGILFRVHSPVISDQICSDRIAQYHSIIFENENSWHGYCFAAVV